MAKLIHYPGGMRHAACGECFHIGQYSNPVTTPMFPEFWLMFWKRKERRDGRESEE
jgi:hypothetical protein